MELDACGLLLRGRADGATRFFFTHRAGELERQAASASLEKKGFAVIDHLLGATEALQLREQAYALYRQQPSPFHRPAIEREPQLLLVFHCDALLGSACFVC